MASADYYPPRRPSASTQPSFLAPPPPMGSYPQTTSAPNGSPHQYPEAPVPPPYQQPLDPNKPNVRFAPSPPLPQQRASFSHGPRPNPQTWNQPHSQIPPPTSNLAQPPYNPQTVVPPGQFLAPPAPPPHMRPYIDEDDSDHSTVSGYSSDPEHHRRRRRHSQGGHERRSSDGKNSRSTNADGLIGAAGGGLIGDLIFPGLGTVGGALVGWLGGKDYGKHRKWREDKRSRQQVAWEEKHGRRDTRSPSKSYDIPAPIRTRSHG